MSNFPKSPKRQSNVIMMMKLLLKRMILLKEDNLEAEEVAEVLLEVLLEL